MSEITQGIKSSGKEFLVKGALSMSANDVIYICLCYLMSSCTFFGGSVPFVLSAYGAAFTGGKWLLFMVASVVGLLGALSGAELLCYLIVLALSTFVIGVVNENTRFKALCVSALLLFVSFIHNLISDALWADYFISVFEAVFCFAGVYVFSEAVPLITASRERRCIMDTELVCVFALLALVVKCTVGFPLIAGMDISVILTILLLLAINMESDISLGTAMGVVFGFVAVGKSLSAGVSMGAFAFASFCAGILNRFGRWGVVLGFVIANAALTVFLRGEQLPFDIFEVIFASILFSLLPGKITGYISSLTSKTVHTATNSFVEEEKLQNVICKKLTALSDSYETLADEYDACFKSNEMSKQYIIRMLDSVSAKICPDCGLKYNCWERCYKESYKAMAQMLEKATMGGKLTEKEVPEPLKGKCNKLGEFVYHFNTMFGIYKVEKMWQDKLNSARKLVSEQVRGISHSIKKTSETLEMSLDIPTEKEIKTALDKIKIPFKDVIFLKGHGDVFTMEILLTEKALTPKEETCIENLIEEVTGISSACLGSRIEKDGFVARFGNRAKYKVSTGSAMMSKDGEKVSGDSLISCFSPVGNFVCALSDGMGAGHTALRESRRATELLKCFVSSGMDLNTALSLINSSLLLCSLEDSFATMDVCSVDLSCGRIDMYKSGAAAGYIKKGNEILKIESDSLPFGVSEDFSDTKVVSVPVGKSAQVILMTDGVYDVFACGGFGALNDIIEHSKTDNPQVVASEILSVAMECTCGKAVDDMSVCVINVWER